MVMMICSTIISQTSNSSSSGSRWARSKTKAFLECFAQNLLRTVEKSCITYMMYMNSFTQQVKTKRLAFRNEIFIRKKKIIMEALDKWKLCLLVVYWPCHDIGSDCWSLPLLSSIQLASDQLIQSSLWIRLSFPLQLITSSVIFHKNCFYCSQHQQQQQQQQLALEQWAQSLLSKNGSGSDVSSYWSFFCYLPFNLLWTNE